MLRALAIVVLLAGCVGTVPNAPVVPIRLDTGGIEPLGTGQRIDFGRHEPGVIATMSRLRGGAPDALTCTDPHITAVAWDDGLALVFERGGFAGWGTRDPALSYDGRATFGLVCIGV